MCSLGKHIPSTCIGAMLTKQVGTNQRFKLRNGLPQSSQG